MHKRYLVQLFFVSLAGLGLAACGGGDEESTSGPQCETNADCADDQSCLSGRCYQACETADDCASGETCRYGGVCVTECESDDDCPSDQQCVESTNTCFDKGAKFEACSEGDDQECASDKYCGDDTCLPTACSDDSDCVGRNMCDAGRCRSGCLPGEGMCSDSEVCNESTNICEPVGCTPGSCSEFQVCNTELDPAECEYTGSCESSEDDAICQAYADEQGAEFPWICNESSGECEPKPPCEGDGDCADDEICIINDNERNTCREGCNCTDGCDRDCPAGDVCNVERECVDGCETDDECVNRNEGDVCIDQQCHNTCESTDDCEVDGLVCREQAGQQICQECSQDNQCPPTQYCEPEAGISEDDDTGLCRDNPPSCPADNWGDNHAQQGAHVIETTPFEPSGEETPIICRDSSSNDDYMYNNGEWWKVSADSGQVVDVTVDYDSEVGNIDLALLNSTGQQLATSIRPPGEDGGTERIIYGVPAQDEFFIHVTQTLTPEFDKADYDFSVDVRQPRECTDDGKEENDSRQDAKSLDPGTEHNLNVCGDDDDFFVLEADQNQRVEVVVKDVPERLGNVDIQLIDSSGQILKTVSDSNGGQLFLEYLTQEAEDLVLKVFMPSGAGRADYTVEWNQSPNQCHDQFEPNDVCPDDAEQLPRTTSEENYQSLSVCTDDDFYAIDLLPRDTVHLSSTYDSRSGELQMTLFGPNSCTTLAKSQSENDLQGSDKELTIDHEAEQGGTFYVHLAKTQGPGNIDHNLKVEVDEGPNCQDDSFEDNDSQNGATQLSRSNIVNGGRDSALVGQRICDSDEDWYCLDANDGDVLEWEVRHDSSNGDLDAFIFDSGGNQVASGTSSSDVETVSHTASGAGEYCVRVAGKSPARNDYNLLTYVNGNGTADADCPDIFENNDSCSSVSSCEAASPQVDTLHEGLLVCRNPSFDPDWYEACVEAGESLTVQTLFSHTEGDIDMEIFGEDDLNNPVQVSNSSNNDEQVSVTSSKDQCFYYRVYLDGSADDNNYDLDVQTSGPAQCPDDSDEPNDSGGNATVVEAPGLKIGQFKCEGDEDWYQVDLEDGQEFEAFVNHDASLGDIDIAIYENNGGTFNKLDESTSTDDDESLVYTPSATKTYYLQIFGKDQARLVYDLLLYRDLDGDGSFDDDEGPEDRQCPDRFEENDSPGDAEALSAGSYGDLLMCMSSSFSADNDWYEVFVPGNATVDAKATFAHADGNIDMRLHEQTSFGLSQVDSSASTDDDESVTATNSSSSGKNYLVEVTGDDGPFRNQYSLDIDLQFAGNCNDDQFAGNDSRSNAEEISAKDYDMQDGLMMCENTEDWFEFTPSSNGSAMFGLSHTQSLGDIGIEIRDGSGSQLGTVTEEVGGNIKIAEYGGLQSGTTYYVRVFPVGGSIIRNPYDLWASFAGQTPSEPWCPDTYERNDERASNHAASVSFSNNRSQHPSALACGAEEDWYQADLSSLRTYHFDTFFEHGSGSDLTIEVRDDNGNVVQDTDNDDIAFGTNDSSSNDEQAVFSPGSSGTFFFGVKNNGSGATTAPFQIVTDNRYTTGSSDASTCQSNYDDSFEENDTDTIPATIGPELPVEIGGQACDQDWYSWTPQSNTTVDVTLYADSSELQLGLAVFEDNIGNVEFTDTSSNNRASGTVSVTGGTEYLIRVTRGQVSGNLTNGPYMLRIE